jgi:hypothetical protein
MSSYIHKSHNVTVLLYHLVFPAKYRRTVIDPEVDKVLRNVCLDIEARYEIKFLEIGTDKDHVHFLGSVRADVFRDENCPGDQKYNGSGGVSAVPAGEEAAVGGGILVGWVFCEYGGQARRRGEDRKVRAEPGTDIPKTS